ncbi:ubiquitin carboxyl-terminal hydrolase 37-like isoform X2 [Rhopilema esculentum]|uniref:ubiquitin carboxyl-terminal hydrolase 37-like isoform X2 n=1 Tax=Rhopilema esculentum TaxID=499914 RepID=UPI0031CDCD61
MAPLKGLGQSPTGVALYEVAGQVKYTGIKILQTSLTYGKLCIYDDKGQYYIGVHGKMFKMFKLNNNIKETRSRDGQLTLVLLDGHQIIAKECSSAEVKILEGCLSKIKTSGTLKGWKCSKPTQEGSLKKDNKENTVLEKSKKLLLKVKKSSPFSSPGKFAYLESSPLLNAVSKSHSHIREGSRIKGKIFTSPASNKENANANPITADRSFERLESKCVDMVSLEDEEVCMVNGRNQEGYWSRPPGEERSHSPSLKYGCRNSSSLGFSTIRSDGLKSRRRLIDTATTHPDELALSLEDDVSDENDSPSTSTRAPLSFKSSASRNNLSPSPLRPKALQSNNQDSASKGVSHKASSFYGGSSSTLPSFSMRKLSSFNWMGKGLKRQLPLQSQEKEKKSFIFRKREKDATQTPSLSNQIALTGFANLGNTCYMNAILQCLLGIPAFSYDLDNTLLLSKVKHISLYKSLHNLLIAKRLGESQDKQKWLLKSIKKAISNQAARFSGNMQHDAHEFLGQCLDQLKEDIIKPSPLQGNEADETTPSDGEQQKSLEAACPVARNFECQVSHNIECEECRNQIAKEEIFYDFSLDIPEIDENTDPEEKNLQDLLQDYFEEEKIGYKCEKCECENANLSHHISKLPRVMILHLKRYELNDNYTKYRKKLDTVNVPLQIDLGILCTEETTKPIAFERIPKSGIKRPLPSDHTIDVDDFEPSYKAKRRLALPDVPKLSNPEEEESSLDFQRDIERAKKLSLDAVKVDSVTEDEQLEWALAESLKTNESLVESDFLPPALLEIDPEVLPVFSEFGGEATEDKRLPVPDRVDAESFTGLQAKKENQFDNEKSEIFLGKNEESEVGGFDDWLSTQEKENEKENDEILIESAAQVDSEEDQLKMALELSLREYNEHTTPRHKPRQVKSNTTGSSDSNKKTKQRRVNRSGCATPRQYNLVGIVSHIGDSSVAGHYICDVFDFKEKVWKSYNDSSVKKITEYEVKFRRKNCAYILFYVEQECYRDIMSK